MGETMTDDELKRLFDAPVVPELDDAARERIVSSAVIRYRHAANDPDPEPSASRGNWFGHTIKPLLGAAAALVIVVMLQHALRLPSRTDGLLDAEGYNAAVFEEYRALFRDELRAVVAHDGDVHVVTGGPRSVQANPVVLVRLEGDGTPVYITAYSGQTIDADIGAKTVTMEILATSDSDVLVASDEFMLDRGVLYGPDALRADARVLETSL